MPTRWWTPSVYVPVMIVGLVAGSIVWVNVNGGRSKGRPSPPPITSAPSSTVTTSVSGLDDTVREMDRRLSSSPGDLRAAIQLTDALMRLARVRADGGVVARGEEVLRRALDAHPADYQAEQMLGSLYLSEHKFRQAIAIAERTRDARPLDPTNYGILGDAHLELGEYEQAFDNFDQMMRLRPNAASYARVAYARELQGHVAAALESMRLALDAVPPTDLESLAWHHAQIGELYLKLGDTAKAEQAFMSASHAFPGHPFAVLGYARTLAAEGDRRGAIAALRAQGNRPASPDVHALLGDLLDATGQHAEATTEYALAEAAWRSDAPEPRNLSKLLASQGRVEEAVEAAESAARTRDDIFTDDALAWAYFKSGRMADAERLAERAMRTGTRDRDVLAHVAAIRGAQKMAAR